MGVGTAIYTLLGIEPEATADEIKSAYRRKALKCHPDSNSDDPVANGKFLKLKKAYDLLSDEGKRREWHSRYGLPWKGDAPSKPKRDDPHEDLNWACAACHGKTEYQCTVCRVRLCPHFTMIVKLEGFLPKPICTDCKKSWNDKKHSHWKLMQMFDQKMGRSF